MKTDLSQAGLTDFESVSIPLVTSARPKRPLKFHTKSSNYSIDNLK